jgi:hypothetical protein
MIGGGSLTFIEFKSDFIKPAAFEARAAVSGLGADRPILA